MRFYPILMSTPMVLASLDDTKTNTRRMLNPQPLVMPLPDYDVSANISWKGYVWHETKDKQLPQGILKLCPYGQAGDVLWVRETFVKIDPHEDNGFYDGFIYRANPNSIEWEMSNDEWRWTPSIFMPKAACRLFLEIVEVRVERLFDITPADAISEGIEVVGDYKGKPQYRDYLQPHLQCSTPAYSFQTLWVSINGQKLFDVNPWVWVIKFVRINKPASFLL